MEKLCKCLVIIAAYITILSNGHVQGFLSDLGKGKRDGLDLLTNIMNIKRIRASFAFKENKVYYLVRFCGKREAFCFITNIYDDDNEKRNKVVPLHSVDVVRDVPLWMKLISVLNGKNNNIRPTEQHMTDDHQKKCAGKYFFITKGPTKKVIKEIWQESKKRKGANTGDDCTRTCLKADGLECHEIRINCLNCCKCYKKRVNLRELRDTSTSSSSST